MAIADGADRRVPRGRLQAVRSRYRRRHPDSPSVKLHAAMGGATTARALVRIRPQASGFAGSTRLGVMELNDGTGAPPDADSVPVGEGFPRPVAGGSIANETQFLVEDREDAGKFPTAPSTDPFDATTDHMPCRCVQCRVLRPIWNRGCSLVKDRPRIRRDRPGSAA